MNDMEFVKTPEEEISKRIFRLKELLHQQGLDFALIQQNANLFYYTGTVQNAYLFVPAKGAPVFFVKKHFEKARAESPIENIVSIKSVKQISDLLDELSIPLNMHGGMEFDSVPVSIFNLWRELLPESTFENASSLIMKQRSIKSAHELEMIRSAGEIVVSTFGEVPDIYKPGMTEIELSTHLVQRMRLKGHPGFVRTRAWRSEVYVGGAVSCGKSAAEPWPFDGPVSAFSPFGGNCTLNSQRPILKNQPVLIDMLGIYNGYIYDYTRTFVSGKLDRGLQEAYSLSVEILDTVMERMIPGALPEDLYDLAVSMAEDHGLSEIFMNHGLNQVRFIGHGIGLELDEIPALAKKFRTGLEEGNVIALEPKFISPDKGGVGVEDTVLVTKEGGKSLWPSQKDIIEI